MAESDLIRGNVDTVILKVLYEGDRYGYDMIKQINARSGGQWEIKQPTLYACLKRLEKQGFVASYWDESDSNGGRRKYYTLTDSGREVFVSYKNEWERSRDLFGELITGDEPILPSDDFSDVEDDEYEVPKRRPRPARQKEKTVKHENEAKVEYVPPAFDETEYIHSEKAPESDAFGTDGADTDSRSSVSESETEETIADDITSPDDKEEQAEPSSVPPTFDENTADGEQDGENIENDLNDDGEGSGTQPTPDPHSVIEEIYASTYTGNRSYSDAHAAALIDEHEDVQKPQKEPAESPAPVPAPAPANIDGQKTALQPYSDALPKERDEESAARREYKSILGDLVERCEKDTESERETKADEQAESAASTDIAVKSFDDVKRAVAELGNEVTVREHNDSAKQYNRKYYYYSNRLMMTHYTAMCAIMFLLGLTLFLTFYVGLGMRMKYDYLLYVFAGLLPIAMFIVAVILFAGEPDKKKRINVNFRFSLIIRIVIMLQAAVVIYCFNLIWGMPVGFSAKYIPSLVIPLVYSLFIPISELIFMTLLKSERYAVE